MIATTVRRRRKVVIPIPPPVTGEPKPYVPSPEFTRAYGSPSGPEAAVWDERGIMHWGLPVHTITQAPCRPYTPRIEPNH
jgi:hypothetical protein